MSTKNLARTILEAGRTSEGTWGRREDNRVHRANTRRALAALREEDSDDFILPIFKKTNRHLDDKLGAPARWLASHVNRPWDKVRGELLARFDTRSLAGRHIVFGHMLTWVDDGTAPRGFCQTKFVVDRHGILRHARAAAVTHN